jgi:hypothetical protein
MGIVGNKGRSYSGPPYFKENMKKFKKASEEYCFLVNEARKLLEAIDCYQIKIAAMAVKACQIKHGGKSANLYTLTDFANDIGMSRKTLSEWTLVYKNVISKLDIPNQDFTKKDWEASYRVFELLRNEKRSVQQIMGTKSKKTSGHISDLSKERIKDLFNQNYEKKTFDSELLECSRLVAGIKNKLSSRDLSTVSISALVSLKENLDNASDVILRNFEGRALKTTMEMRKENEKQHKPKAKRLLENRVS